LVRVESGELRDEVGCWSREEWEGFERRRESLLSPLLRSCELEEEGLRTSEPTEGVDLLEREMGTLPS